MEYVFLIVGVFIGTAIAWKIANETARGEMNIADAFCKDCKKLLYSPRGAITYTADGVALRVERAYCDSCGLIWNYYSEVPEETP